MVQLLQPLLALEGFPTEDLQDIVWAHARQGRLLLNKHYQSRYTHDFQSPFQMLAALHLIDVVARPIPRERGQSNALGSEAILLGHRILSQSLPRVPVAGPFQEMLRKTAINCGITSSNRDEKQLQNNNSYREDDLIDACTRHTYAQPVEAIQKRYSPSFSADWASHGALFGFQPTNPSDTSSDLASIEGSENQSVMSIRTVLNLD